MTTKAYDANLSDTNDGIARKKVSTYFSKKPGFHTENNPDKYGPDLLLYINNEFFTYVEVEIKKNWTAFDWPPRFLDVQIPGRKGKFAESYPGMIFFVLNYPLDNMCGFTGKDLLDSCIKPVNNILTRHQEFFKVPLDKVKFISLK